MAAAAAAAAEAEAAAAAAEAEAAAEAAVPDAAIADDPAPRSEATRDKPPDRRWRRCSATPSQPPLVHMPSSKEKFEKTRRRLHLAHSLNDVDTSFDSLFARREREKAMSSLTREALLRDKKEVKGRVTNANWMIIKQNSLLMAMVDSSTLFALIWTATVTPFEIAFVSEPGVVLTAANYVVLCVFAFGMLAAFCIPYREPLWKGGAFIRDHYKIAMHYLTTWFVIDLISTVPIDQLIAMSLSSGEAGDQAQGIRGWNRTHGLPYVHAHVHVMRGRHDPGR